MDDKKLLLLGLLRHHDMHGYQLNEFIENALSLCVDIKKPTAYYVLNKLAEEGMVRFEEEQDGNRPPRRVYSLTQTGEEQFQKLLRQNLGEFSPARFDGDIGLAYLDALQPEEALPLLLKRREALEAQLAAIRLAPAHQGSLQLMIQHQIKHLEAELSWLDEIIQSLQKTN